MGIYYFNFFVDFGIQVKVYLNRGKFLIVFNIFLVVKYFKKFFVFIFCEVVDMIFNQCIRYIFFCFNNFSDFFSFCLVFLEIFVN